jgi:uncharacterized protein
MIPRLAAAYLQRLAGYYPVVVVTGPRQSGKTTLVRAQFPDLAYFNLEAPDVRARVEADPRGFLLTVPDGVIFDEFQRIPELVSYIQVVADANPKNRQFILTGSQQLEVMNKVSQSLAGRVGLLKLLPLSLEEMYAARASYPLIAPTESTPGSEPISNRSNDWIHSGFYPRIIDQKIPPPQALSDYFATYVQRDVRSLSNVADLSQFEKFVRLCAGRIGQLLNLQNLTQDLGITYATGQRWLTILQASYMVHLVQPYHWRTSKRLVKSAKLYFYDVGLASWLIGVETPAQLATHPLRGPLFENMVMMEALKFRLNRGLRDNLYFYRDSDGAEVDLILEFALGIYPIEIKSGLTVSSDYFKGLKHLAKLVASGSSQPPNGGGLIYAGSQAWQQSGTQIVGFERTAELLCACAADR